MASVGSILGGAFRLLRDRPGHIAVWAVTYCIGSLIISGIMTLLMFGTMTPAPAQAQPSVWMGPVLSLILLLYLLLLLLFTVLMNAVFRAVLRPDEGGFFLMRLGMDELRMLGLLVLVYIAASIAVVIGWLLLLLVVMIVGFALGSGMLTGAISFVLFLAFFGALIWAYVRLSLIFPLSFYRRRMTIDGAWELTRGHFWTLFACYFLIGLIFFVASAALIWSMMGDYFVALMQSHGDQEQMRAAAEALAARQFAMPIGMRILMGAVGTVYFAVALALGPGLLASATRELLADDGEAPVFAAESD